MAYPSGIDNGYCPSTHPVHLVSIFYELWFSVAPFNALNDGGKFVLSTGDPNGFSLHGDFMNGWDNDVLSRAVQTCTDDSGVIENCGVFANENRFVSNSEMASCAAPNPLPSEDVGDSGSIPYLPGCVAITDGPGPASAADLDPNCVAASGGSSSVTPASSSATPQSSSMTASGANLVAAASPTPASGDDSVGDGSVPSIVSTSSLTITTSVYADDSVPSPSSVGVSSYDSIPTPSITPVSGNSADDSVPSPSSVGVSSSSYDSIPTPSVTPVSGDSDDDSVPSPSSVGVSSYDSIPTPSITPVSGDGTVPSMCSAPADVNSILSSFLSSVFPTGVPASLSSLLVLPTPVPSNVNVDSAGMPSSTASYNLPSGGDNYAVDPTGNSSPSPSSSPAVSPTTSSVQPSYTPTTGSGQQDDDSDGDGETCSSSGATYNKRTRRQHHVRRAKHGKRL
jgi:hypothetical protein